MLFSSVFTFSILGDSWKGDRGEYNVFYKKDKETSQNPKISFYRLKCRASSFLCSSDQRTRSQTLDATCSGFSNSLISCLCKTTKMQLAFIYTNYFSLSPRMNIQFNYITSGTQKQVLKYNKKYSL